MTYCEVTDLILTGDVNVPSYLDPQKFINDAADEIDSKIGFIYETPIVITGPSTTTPRPVRLLLKRLNIFIASGRLLLSAATGGEESEVHQYGLYLLQEAYKTLDAIADGTLQLPDTPPAQDDDPTIPANVPLIANAESASMVDTFYDGLVAPDGLIDPNRSYIPVVPWPGG